MIYWKWKKKKVNITVEKNKVLYTQKQEHKTENHMWQFNLYDKHEMNNMLLIV